MSRPNCSLASGPPGRRRAAAFGSRCAGETGRLSGSRFERRQEVFFGAPRADPASAHLTPLSMSGCPPADLCVFLRPSRARREIRRDPRPAPRGLPGPRRRAFAIRDRVVRNQERRRARPDAARRADTPPGPLVRSAQRPASKHLCRPDSSARVAPSTKFCGRWDDRTLVLVERILRWARVGPARGSHGGRWSRPGAGLVTGPPRPICAGKPASAAGRWSRRTGAGTRVRYGPWRPCAAAGHRVVSARRGA